MPLGYKLRVREKNEIVWDSKETDTTVVVVFSPTGRGNWLFSVHDGNRFILQKEIATKERALSSAKSWMRRHPNS